MFSANGHESFRNDFTDGRILNMGSHPCKSVFLKTLPTITMTKTGHCKWSSFILNCKTPNSMEFMYTINMKIETFKISVTTDFFSSYSALRIFWNTGTTGSLNDWRICESIKKNPLKKPIKNKSFLVFLYCTKLHNHVPFMFTKKAYKIYNLLLWILRFFNT